MASKNLLQIEDPGKATAWIAPDLGGWLLRFSKYIPEHGWTDVLHFSQEIVDRYPKEMYTGSPVLFPLVSFNHTKGKEHSYFWKGKLYEMPQHGFARRMPWRVVNKSTDSVVLELNDTPETLQQYPFKFSYKLTYSIQHGKIHLRQELANRSHESMPFSSGFHPYFSAPIGRGSRKTDCTVRVPQCERMVMRAQGDQFVQAPVISATLRASDDFSDAWFLTSMRSRELALVDEKAKLESVINFSNAAKYRFAALWSKSPQEPFFCLEPWTALPNSFNREKELVLLAPDEVFWAEMWIDCRVSTKD